jgi:hypothetical protein
MQANIEPIHACIETKQTGMKPMLDDMKPIHACIGTEQAKNEKKLPQASAKGRTCSKGKVKYHYL